MGIRATAHSALVVAVGTLVVIACGAAPAVTEQVSVGSVSTAAVEPTETIAPGTTAATSATTGPTVATDAAVALPDPCSLLSTDDLQSATGLTFAAGTANTELGAGLVTCDWITTGDEFATAQVLILAGAGAYESNKQTTEEVFGITEIEILGAEEAYASEEGSLIGLSIGGNLVQVAYIPPDPGNVLDQTLQLATTAAANY